MALVIRMARKIVRFMPAASRASARRIIGGTRMSISRCAAAYNKADLTLNALTSRRHNPNHSFPLLAGRGLQRKVARWVAQ